MTVDYQEKTYAAGRIPGGFFKREGRPSEKEILTSRLIDRPIRPLFPEGFTHEVQIIATVMSIDPDIDPDIVAMIGASAALSLSGAPFNGPVGAARVGYQNGQYLLNPGNKALKDSQLDLVVAGTEKAVLMVESEAKELSEEVMLGAVMFGHEQMQAAIRAIRALCRDAGTQRWEWKPPVEDTALKGVIATEFGKPITEAYRIPEKTTRQDRMAEIREQAVGKHAAEECGRGHEGEGTQDRRRSRISHRASPDHFRRTPHRRARHAHRASDHHSYRRTAAHARLGAVHPRRDPGHRRDHARHQPRRTDH